MKVNLTHSEFRYYHSHHCFAGLRFSLHTGTSWGYGGLAVILHDVDIAIFTGITGRDKDFTGRYTLVMYIIDKLLGYEPWINKTSACTFPEPWFERKTNTRNESAALMEPGSDNVTVRAHCLNFDCTRESVVHPNIAPIS